MSAPQYKSAARLHTWVVTMLGAAVVAATVLVVSCIADFVMWSAAADDPASASRRALLVADNRRAALLVLNIGWLLVTGVVFVIWFRRMHRNLTALGVGSGASSWLTIGGWVIPFGNLFIPFSFARHMARAGDVEPRPTGLVAGWWAAWIITGAIGFGLSSAWSDAAFADDIAAAAMRTAIYAACVATTAVLAAKMVRALTARAEHLATTGAPVSA